MQHYDTLIHRVSACTYWTHTSVLNPRLYVYCVLSINNNLSAMRRIQRPCAQQPCTQQHECDEVGCAQCDTQCAVEYYTQCGAVCALALAIRVYQNIFNQ